MIFHITSILLILIFYNDAAVISSCCSQQDSSSPCLSYDDSMMAESLDQALYSFPNLASDDKSTLFHEQPSVSTRRPTNRMSISSISLGSANLGADCVTKSCMSCKLSIVNGFLSNPSISAEDYQSFSQQKSDLVLKLGTTQGSCSSSRKKRQSFTVHQNFRSYVLSNPQTDAVNQNNIQYDSSTSTSTTTSTASTTTTTTTTQSSKTENTSKAKNSTVLGVVTSLGCDYTRGEVLNDSTEWCGLCNLCWQWRKLPDDYYPNYLNEVNCDEKNGGCLSGYGTCNEVYKSISILRKMDDEWKKVSIDTVSACECQVMIGSPLHSLVVK